DGAVRGRADAAELVESPCRAPGGTESVEDRLNAIRRKVPLIAKKSQEARSIRRSRRQVASFRHQRILKERANLVEPTGQLRPNLRGRAVKGAPLANSLHGRFRPDPFDSRVEIGTHKDRDVDELLAGQAQVAQVLLQVEDLRRDRPGPAGAGEGLARSVREGPHKA